MTTQQMLEATAAGMLGGIISLLGWYGLPALYRCIRDFRRSISKPYLVSPDDADGIVANEEKPDPWPPVYPTTCPHTGTRLYKAVDGPCRWYEVRTDRKEGEYVRLYEMHGAGAATCHRYIIRNGWLRHAP